MEKMPVDWEIEKRVRQLLVEAGADKAPVWEYCSLHWYEYALYKVKGSEAARRKGDYDKAIDDLETAVVALAEYIKCLEGKLRLRE